MRRAWTAGRSVASVNEEYQDRLIGHQIGLRRYSSAVARRVIALLDRTRPDVRALLLDRLSDIEERGFDIGPATTARLRRLDDDLRDLLAEAHASIADDVGASMVELADYEVGYQAKLFDDLLPVRFNYTRPPAAVMRAIVYSQPFQGRVLKDWTDQFAAGDRRRMMDGIRMGMVEGETPTQITRRILGAQSLNYADGTREISRRGLLTLVQTATAHVSSRSRQAWAEETGVVEQEVFIATLDSKTTFQCASLDGRKYRVGQGPTPPLHPNCRSTRAPYIDGAMVGTRPGVAVKRGELEGLSPAERKKRIKELVGPVPAETTFDQWLKRQRPDFVNDYLGEERARLYRQGRLTMRDLVDRNGKPWTLEELAQREGMKLAA